MEEYEVKKISSDFFKRVLFIALGCLIISISINVFIAPHSLLSGGVSGIALILFYLTKIPTGYLIFLLNVPVFIIGLKQVDREFIIISFFGMILFSFTLILTRPLHDYFYIEDLLASCIAGGVVSGIGNGLIFRQRGSLGGSDIISVVLRKKYSIEMSTLIFGINLVVVTLGMIINSVTLSIYTLISMYISSSVLNIILDGLDRKKMLIIVTTKGEKCAEGLTGKMKRGVTMLSGKGGYTGEEKEVLQCAVSSRQIATAKKIVLEIDPNSFISIIDVAEVQGRGFKGPIF